MHGVSCQPSMIKSPCCFVQGEAKIDKMIVKQLSMFPTPISKYGYVLKSGYLQIIHFHRFFHYKPNIFGYLHLWKPPSTGSWLSPGISRRPRWDHRTHHWATAATCVALAAKCCVFFCSKFVVSQKLDDGIIYRNYLRFRGQNHGFLKRFHKESIHQ